MNGEWDAEISGIWVAKYEMSMEKSTDSGESWTTTTTSSATIGNVLTAPNSIRMVSKPSVSSWRYITIGNMYTICQEYDNNLGLENSLNSHLMKNSEWGAVVYLTHSKYGRNKTKVNTNRCTGHITGAGSISQNAGYAYDATTFETTYAYNTTNGKLASSTGNITGVYDLSGGAYEYVAAYISNGNSNLSYGSGFANITANADGYKTLSTKYVTVYPYYISEEKTKDTSDTGENNYTAYKNSRTEKYGYGDALTETFRWTSSYCGFATSNSPFFLHGGSCNDGSDIFASYGSAGSASNYRSFRAVLVVE